MAIIKIQGEEEIRRGISYQFESTDKPIGEGGMGKVYKGLCVNERNGSTRPVAIKFMFDDLPANAYERARREAEIQLRNDNLVEMLGFIETRECLAGGEVLRHYHVVSELLTGVSLSDVLEGRTKDRDGEDVPFAVKMLQDFKNDPEHFAQIVVMNVLSGLMALHDAGYIHRDIDPSNIMLTSDGHIKIIDFGIAKQMNNLTTGDKALTVAGKFMGKPEYAAPELALGDISHQNQTTDIYAVGILLYQCIVGHTPFEGARHEILEKQLKEKLPLGKVKNKALRAIIARACEKKQELRFHTSAQMRVALETMNADSGFINPKNKKLFFGGAAALVVLLIIVGVVVKIKHDASKEEARLAQERTEQAIMEQKQAEAAAAMDSKMAEGDALLAKGMDTETDDYELQLMKAYEIYADAVELARDSMEAQALVEKQQEVCAFLDSAQVRMQGQAAELTGLGLGDMAQTYTDRAEGIREFLNKINNEKNKDKQ